MLNLSYLSTFYGFQSQQFWFSCLQGIFPMSHHSHLILSIGLKPCQPHSSDMRVHGHLGPKDNIAA